MKTVFLGLGSNLGDRAKILQDAKKNIEESIGRIKSVSLVYETEPWGFESESKFLNMVLSVETDLSPSGLLGRILMIESRLGRIRYKCGFKFSSRSIDIDILLYNNEVVNETALQIPHPGMHLRRFVLEPLSKIAPELIHPVLKKTILTLLEECKDTGKVVEYSKK
jgi:2-amino-4-hydroxy-6-hydroxymethyldihydropteridine diphosphokinase